MGEIKPFPSGILIIAILSKNPQPIDEVSDSIELAFGSIVSKSDILRFDHSHYYAEEMGSDLFKQWVAIPQVGILSPTSTYKERTQVLESHFMVNGRRTVNLDPGLLFAHQLLLFSTKNYAHRLPIANGIYAELELAFKANEWQSLPWTYPDYLLPVAQQFFAQCRKLLL
ncbi:DUF4416 family protein [bacterium]|nr:DUF4416 family protein [bacterium]